MKLFTVDAVRGFDQTAINDWGIPGDVLMARAGEGAWRAAEAAWPELSKVAVFCGAGNNGGDGWVVARLAMAAGRACRVYCEPDRGPATDTAAHARDAFVSAGGEVATVLPEQPLPADTLLVDGLLGIGLSSAPRGWASDAIGVINRSGGPVIALDCPSGLDANTGAAPGNAVVASMTVTFIAAKRGLYTGKARDHTGKVVLDSLDLPLSKLTTDDVECELLELSELQQIRPARRPSAHKGSAGHLLVIGGDHGMGGAALMAAEAALRTGAGLVSVATRQEHVPAILARCPEVMASQVDDPADLIPLLDRATAVIMGPGLGTGMWGSDLMSHLGEIAHPIVLDADALNLLARNPIRLPEAAIITPHPGEAGRLLECPTATVEADRFAAVAELSERFGVTAVLKGAGTLVSDSAAQRATGVCPFGNPGMASGGMGDVLSGVLGSLLAQGMGAPEAARLGVMLHSGGADLAAARQGMCGLVATDLIPAMRELLNDTGALDQN